MGLLLVAAAAAAVGGCGSVWVLALLLVAVVLLLLWPAPLPLLSTLLLSTLEPTTASALALRASRLARPREGAPTPRGGGRSCCCSGGCTCEVAASAFGL